MSQISQKTYKPDKNIILAYQTICDHMFSYPKSDHNFHFLSYICGIYFSSRMWKFSTYFEDGKVLESTVS